MLVQALSFQPVKNRFSMLCQLLLLCIGFWLASLMPSVANVCRSIQAELATIGSAQQDNRYARHYAGEAARLHSHMQSIGCDRQSFLMFGKPAPRECQGYRAQLAQFQAAAGAGQRNTARRQQLLSMQTSHGCNNRAPRELTAGLFDDGSRRSSLEVRPNTRIDPDDDDESPREGNPRVESRIRGISGKAVCVRLCDGFYFPLDLRSSSVREDGEAACQMLCPASDTKVFIKPGEIENARSLEGENYTALPNALRYRKTYDATCYCRQQGETFSSQLPRVLNSEGRPSSAPFSVLNQELGATEEELALRGATDSISKTATGLNKNKKAKLFNTSKTLEPPPPQDAPEIPADRMVLSTQGEMREFGLPDGSKRTVRVIGTIPALVPTMAAPASAPVHGPGQ
jgi:hypothetical protein